jgi:hypothetical protein
MEMGFAIPCSLQMLHIIVCKYLFSFFYPSVSNTKVLFKLNNGSVFYTVNCYVLEMEDFLDKRKYKSGTQSKNISDHLKSSLLKKFAAFCDCLRLT